MRENEASGASDTEFQSLRMVLVAHQTFTWPSFQGREPCDRVNFPIFISFHTFLVKQKKAFLENE